MKVVLVATLVGVADQSELAIRSSHVQLRGMDRDPKRLSAIVELTGN